MTTPLELAPILLDDVAATIDGTDYSVATSSVELTPTAPVTRWPGMARGRGVVLVGEPEWDAALTFAQDWTTAGSLSQLLAERYGETVTMTFQPKRGGTGTPTVTAQVVLIPTNIGGAGRAAAASTVSLPVIGQPVIAPSAAD